MTAMKHSIQKIDRLILMSSITRVYKFYLTFKAFCKNKTITPLRRGTKNIYSLKERFEFFQSAQYFLQVNRINGVYMEFGCHEVSTFRMALNTLGSHGKPNRVEKFIAFDSFEGMPEPECIDKQKIWRSGMNFTSLNTFRNITKRDSYRVEAVKGYYYESLKKWRFPPSSRLAMAYIDCDYYSSTVDVLTFLEDKISHGTLLAFDDWDCYYSDPGRGQRKAFAEFKERLSSDFSFQYFRTIGTGGASFICLRNDISGTDVL